MDVSAEKTKDTLSEYWSGQLGKQAHLRSSLWDSLRCTCSRPTRGEPLFLPLSTLLQHSSLSPGVTMADIHPILRVLPEARLKPRKPPERRRSKRIPVLVSDEEHARLLAMARERKCTLSDILRASIQRIPPRPIDQAALAEMAQITSRLSLLLHDANRYKSPEPLIGLITYVQVLFDQIYSELL